MSLNRAGDKVAVKPHYPFSLSVPYVHWQPNKRTAVNGPVCRKSDETKWNQPVEVSHSVSFFFIFFSLPQLHRLCPSIPSFSDTNTTKMRAPGNGRKVFFFLHLFFSKASIQFVQHVCKEMEPEFMAVRKGEKQLCLITSTQSLKTV